MVVSPIFASCSVMESLSESFDAWVVAAVWGSMGLVVAGDGRGWARAGKARMMRANRNEVVLIWFSNVRQGRTYGAGNVYHQRLDNSKTGPDGEWSIRLT